MILFQKGHQLFRFLVKETPTQSLDLVSLFFYRSTFYSISNVICIELLEIRTVGLALYDEKKWYFNGNWGMRVFIFFITLEFRWCLLGS